MTLAAGQRQDRACRRAPDAGQRHHLVECRWKLAAVALHEHLRRALQVAGARVVAEPGPQVQHFVERRRRELAHVGKARDEALVVAGDRSDLRLLQHDLGDPDAVRRAVALPRQVLAPVAFVPARAAPARTRAALTTSRRGRPSPAARRGNGPDSRTASSSRPGRCARPASRSADPCGSPRALGRPGVRDVPVAQPGHAVAVERFARRSAIREVVLPQLQVGHQQVYLRRDLRVDRAQFGDDGRALGRIRERVDERPTCGLSSGGKLFLRSSSRFASSHWPRRIATVASMPSLAPLLRPSSLASCE